MTNELVAKQVMGWEYSNELWQTRYSSMVDLPNFLTDMNAAMMVVEKMMELRWFFSLEGSIDMDDEVYHHVQFSNSMLRIYRDSNESLPTAICTAALKAMEAS